jgi:hypothetical protein
MSKRSEMSSPIFAISRSRVAIVARTNGAHWLTLERQVELLRVELLRRPPELLPPQLGDDALQTPLRLLRLCKRCLGLGELGAETGVLFGKASIGHGPDQGTGLRR